MRSRLAWLLVGGAVAAIAVIVIASSQVPTPSGHASTSDAADGTSLLRQYAAGLGHPVLAPVADATGAIPEGGLLFEFTPLSPLSPPAATRIADWVRRGGTLVYASEQPDLALEAVLGIGRLGIQGRYVRQYLSGPVLSGVTQLSGGAHTLPLLAPPAAAPIVRSATREVLGLEEWLGKGRVIVLADPLVLCNGYLGRSDNGLLAADLLAMAPTGAVVFDEAWHRPLGPPPEPGSAAGWAAAPWGAAILWAAAATFVGLALRGRAFGPRMPLEPVRERSMAEYVVAVGSLLRKTGARSETARLLLAATRKSLAGRSGLARRLNSAQLEKALGERAPELAARLREAEAQVAVAGSEDELLRAARRLHDLAQPEMNR